MEYSIAPDGIMCGVIDTVSQEQISKIMGGNYPKMAISLQESFKKCVPDFLKMNVSGGLDWRRKGISHSN